MTTRTNTDEAALECSEGVNEVTQFTLFRVPAAEVTERVSRNKKQKWVPFFLCNGSVRFGSDTRLIYSPRCLFLVVSVVVFFYLKGLTNKFTK
jgi:hypothetical protein